MVPIIGRGGRPLSEINKHFCYTSYFLEDIQRSKLQAW